MPPSDLIDDVEKDAYKAWRQERRVRNEPISDAEVPPPYLTRSTAPPRPEVSADRPLHRMHTKRIPNSNAYVPSAKASRRVRALAMLGVSKRLIAQDLGINVETMNKHYARELDQGELEAYAQVAGRLFKKAMAGDTIAMIFWMKAHPNVGWRDRPTEVNHTHTHTISHEERLRLLEADPTATDDGSVRKEEGPGEAIQGAEARWTETGAPIIDGEGEAEEEPGLEEVIEDHDAQLARAKQVERGDV